MKSINRRTFIKGFSIAGMAGVITASGCGNAIQGDSPSQNENSGTDYPNSRKLFYNEDGKFKILQLTDTHYVSGDSRSETALKNVNVVLDSERPDLVIHTGDTIYGTPAETSIREILEPISKRGIPFAVTFGNHDDEYDKSREELFEIVKSIPHSLIASEKDISGVTNYVLTLGSSSTEKPDRIFYLFDSNAYSSIEGIKGYGHIHFDQIEWYRERSQFFTSKNNGSPVPSLAFFHIPLPEYKLAVRSDHAIVKGEKGEDVCSPNVNSGLFVSMKEMKDVQAMFVGHDHNNDFSVFWNNMFFIYGRFSGADTVYNDLKPNGARIIELTEGEAGFSSWIRLSSGEIIQKLQYPDDFLEAV
ncbi:MAG: metallophosphoesterase family protein [Bacteroidota bacterium]